MTDGIVTIYYDVDVLADAMPGGNVQLLVIVAVGTFIAHGWCYCHCKYSSCLADVIAKVVDGMPTMGVVWQML